MHTLSVEEFADFLSDIFDEDIVNIIQKNKIAGATFLKLSERQIEKMIPAMGDVVELRELQARVNSLKEQVKNCERGEMRAYSIKDGCLK